MDALIHFGKVAATAQREVTVIPAMLDDLYRTIRVLVCDIATEEERTRIQDAANPKYSMLARALRARLENLNATAASLQLRLATLRNGGRSMAA